MNIDFSKIDFANLSGGEIFGMILGAIGLLGGGVFLVRSWLDKME
jgi:hypothetical protein